MTFYRLLTGLTLIAATIFVISSATFALNQDSFIFGQCPIGSGDKDYIKTERGNGRLIAYETSGALVSRLRNGDEYGFMVNQIRIYDKATKKLFCVYSDDIDRPPNESMRGAEADFGRIRYISKTKLEFEVFWKKRLDGYVTIDLSAQNLSYRKANPQAPP